MMIEGAWRHLWGLYGLQAVTVSRMAGEASDQARSYGRSAGLLTGALGTAGILAYLFFVVASHSLPEEDYGRVVVLWSATFLFLSVLFRPVEQLLARSVADLEERRRPIQHACRVAAVIQIALATAFCIAALAAKSAIVDKAFDGKELFFWVLFGAVLGFAASYFARGFFAGTRRMAWYAALLLVEGSVRLGLALAVAVGIYNGVTPVALAIAIAPFASLLVVPLALRSKRLQTPTDDQSVGVSTAADATGGFSVAEGGGFALAVLLIMLSEQVLLNSGVLWVRGSESAAAAGFIFNVLMIARAPVVLFQAVAASLLPHLTRLRSRGDETSDEAFALSINMTILVIAGFSAVVVLGLLAVGPTVMQIAFSDKFEYDRLALLIVGVGMGLYLTAATLSQAALAQGQIRRAAACWVLSSLVFVGINLTSTMSAFRNVEVGFAVSAALLCLGLFALYRQPRAARDPIRPGSTHEIEARLLAADDIT